MKTYVDYEQVVIESRQGVDTDGEEIDGTFYVIPVLVPLSDVAELLANYDSASGTSPSVTYARPLSRNILDALVKKESI